MNYKYYIGILETIQLCVNNLYEIGILVIILLFSKNVNINIQYMQFPKRLALNNPRQVDMSLKSINQECYYTCR